MGASGVFSINVASSRRPAMNASRRLWVVTGIAFSSADVRLLLRRVVKGDSPGGFVTVHPDARREPTSRKAGSHTRWQGRDQRRPCSRLVGAPAARLDQLDLPGESPVQLRP